jgi:hypothetical protein
MNYKPMAASFTIVIELVLLTVVFLVSALVYDSLYHRESVLMVSTLAVSTMAAAVNLVGFMAFALYRKSSVLRWHYFQAVTQATFCTVLLSALMYYLGWIMHNLGQPTWTRELFAYSEGASVQGMHSIARLLALAMHVIVVMVAGLGAFASTSEGSTNLLWFNAPFVVTLGLVWVAMFEVVEFGALYCYAHTADARAAVFACVNLTFTLMFVLHMLDTLEYEPFWFPWWMRRPAVSIDSITRSVQGSLDGYISSDGNSSLQFGELASNTVQLLQDEVSSDVVNLSAQSRSPILNFWRLLQVYFTFILVCVLPLVRMYGSSPAVTYRSDELILLLFVVGIPCFIFFVGVLLCFDFFSLLSPSYRRRFSSSVGVVNAAPDATTNNSSSSPSATSSSRNSSRNNPAFTPLANSSSSISNVRPRKRLNIPITYSNSRRYDKTD